VQQNYVLFVGVGRKIDLAFCPEAVNLIMIKALIVSLLTLSMTLSVLAQATPESTPEPTEDTSNVLADCIKLLPSDRPIESGANAPSVRIVQPTTDVVYGSAVTIQIQTKNFDVNSNGQHWHLWVNGTLTGMVYQPNAVIDLAPGDYTICASLGNNQHADIGMPDGIHLKVEAAQVGTPTATLAVDRAAAQVQPEGQIGGGQIALLVGGGLLAAVGGWWIGNRMPKGKKK
jgi:hypothetical protein